MRAKQASIQSCQNLAGQIGGTKQEEKQQQQLNFSPFVVGVLGTISKNLSTSLNAVGIPDIIESA